jgi:hypothetical protein
VKQRKDMPAAVAALAGNPARLGAMRETIARYSVPKATEAVIKAMQRAIGEATVE